MTKVITRNTGAPIKGAIIFCHKNSTSKRVIWKVVASINIRFPRWWFPMLPSRLVNSIIFLGLLIKYKVYIMSGFKTNQVKWIFVLYFVFRRWSQIRIYSEPYVHKEGALSRFFYHTWVFVVLKTENFCFAKYLFIHW